MSRPNLDDTIVAISTPIGESGIGIVRMSGSEALLITDKIFSSKDGKSPSEFETYTTHYGWIIDSNQKPVTSNQKSEKANYRIIDEVILTVMRSPRSYTKEDIVEINCHSGIIPLKKVLELVIKIGARMAEPGEFTKRAFINGRIDLAQAEAVLDVIRSKTDVSLKVALRQLGGDLSRKVRELRDQLLDIQSNIEASIDFPEEEIEILSVADLLNRITEIKERLARLLDTADRGIVLREGITTVICGKPNVGKSSLMNALLRQTRVIVTPIPGTTRDAIEEIVNIEGIPLKIVDTAGIIEPKDLIETEGVVRSRLYLNRADLILLVLDGSSPLSDEDRKLMEEISEKKTIVVVNKTDLPVRIDIDRIRENLPDKRIIKVSATERTGLSLLEEAVVEMIWRGEVVSGDVTLITNVRHKEAVRKAYEALKGAVQSIERQMSPEFIAIDVKEAIDSLGEILGETVTEDILERIFSQFCIGK